MVKYINSAITTDDGPGSADTMNEEINALRKEGLHLEQPRRAPAAHAEALGTRGAQAREVL
jgi:hypothetical protein